MRILEAYLSTDKLIRPRVLLKNAYASLLIGFIVTCLSYFNFIEEKRKLTGGGVPDACPGACPRIHHHGYPVTFVDRDPDAQDSLHELRWPFSELPFDLASEFSLEGFATNWAFWFLLVFALTVLALILYRLLEKRTGAFFSRLIISAFLLLVAFRIFLILSMRI